MDCSWLRLRPTLRVKLTLLIEACIILLVTVMGVTTTMREKAALEEELRKRGLALTSDLARLAARPLLSRDLPTLRRLVNHSMAQEYVRYVVVLDRDGKAVMHSDLSEVGKLYRDFTVTKALSSLLPGYTDVHDSSTEELHSDMFAPILVSDIRLGAVRLGYSHMGIENQLAHARRQIFIIALLTTLAGGIVSYLVASYISSPIKRITEATRHVANGSLGPRINVSRRDEIGALAGAFNKMTEDLRATMVSKEYFDNIIRSMNDTLVVIDPDAKIMIVNRAACELLEYEASELIGKDVGVIVIQESSVPGVSGCRELMAGSGFESQEMHYVTRSGKLIPVDFASAVLKNKNGKIEGSVCIARDVTERKVAEAALRKSEKQLQYLYSQLLSAQEKERRRLSVELHDELGQSLMVLNLKLRSIREGLGSSQGELKHECDAMHAYIKEIAENVRRLSRNLSPTILEDLGLWAAIRRLTESFGEHSGIECSLDLPKTDGYFSKEEEITVYRMAQECLTNTAKHAAASHLTLSIRREGGSVLFQVEDDGNGFDVHETFHQDPGKIGLGLAALQERARILGGSMEVWSQEGAGTRITFTLPLGKKGAAL